jgi:hypothetical protein
MEHLRQHERVTNADRVVQDAVERLDLTGEPKVTQAVTRLHAAAMRRATVSALERSCAVSSSGSRPRKRSGLMTCPCRVSRNFVMRRTLHPRSGIDQASQAPMPVNAATVTKAARKASPISACTTACRAGASVAIASGPWSIMVRTGLPFRCRSPRGSKTRPRRRRGAEGGADRARELHHGGAGAQHPLPGHGLHRDLHHAHDRAHETARWPPNTQGSCRQAQMRRPESEEQQAALPPHIRRTETPRCGRFASPTGR